MPSLKVSRIEIIFGIALPAIVFLPMIVMALIASAMMLLVGATKAAGHDVQLASSGSRFWVEVLVFFVATSFAGLSGIIGLWASMLFPLESFSARPRRRKWVLILMGIGQLNTLALLVTVFKNPDVYQLWHLVAIVLVLLAPFAVSMRRSSMLLRIGPDHSSSAIG